ncbi:MAG TPA: SHOCT domain-containing protein [Burkholderiales bacterium]|nr:SHOCT domain-containing protein [Burkholderiales bacterium]
MDGHYWGMHFFWWIFWVGMLVVLFSLAPPVPKSRMRTRPMEILQRRYAAGEIGAEEYEERRATLLRDRADDA